MGAKQKRRRNVFLILLAAISDVQGKSHTSTKALAHS
jgi:hypothetical protein